MHACNEAGSASGYGQVADVLPPAKHEQSCKYTFSTSISCPLRQNSASLLLLTWNNPGYAIDAVCDVNLCTLSVVLVHGVLPATSPYDTSRRYVRCLRRLCWRVRYDNIVEGVLPDCVQGKCDWIDRISLSPIQASQQLALTNSHGKPHYHCTCS
jgi:hypothetical protein